MFVRDKVQQGFHNKSEPNNEYKLWSNSEVTTEMGTYNNNNNNNNNILVGSSAHLGGFQGGPTM